MISVVIPVFNNQRSIKLVVDSVIKNLKKNDELIIIDDHSTDGTWQILRSFKEKEFEFSFVLLRNKENLGISPTLNLGIKIASKEFIVRHDGDDIMIFGRLKHQIKLMKSNRNIDFISSSKIIFKKYPISKKLPSIKNYSKDLKIINKNNLALNNLITHPAVICKAKVLKENLYNNSYNCDGEDYQLWLRLIIKGYKLYLDPTPVIMYYENNYYSKIKRQLIGSIKLRINMINFNFPIFSLYLLLGSLNDFLRLIYKFSIYE